AAAGDLHGEGRSGTDRSDRRAVADAGIEDAGRRQRNKSVRYQWRAGGEELLGTVAVAVGGHRPCRRHVLEGAQDVGAVPWAIHIKSVHVSVVDAGGDVADVLSRRPGRTGAAPQVELHAVGVRDVALLHHALYVLDRDRRQAIA